MTNIAKNDILNKRYQILEKIASGGMAEVYQSYDRYLKRIVAIKIMSAKLIKNEKAIERFNKEGDAITRLRHNNIVEVYDIFQENNYYCIVLELVKGYTLKDRLLSLGPCTLNELIYFFDNISQGILEAHKNNIIHRDIKPENILISYDGKIEVADFGIALIENIDNHDTDQGKIVGTAKYIPPEVVQSKQPDKRSDIYSLGIMLYELTIGTAPFTASKPTVLVVKHIKEAVIAPRKVNPNIPQSLENVILKSLAKNPINRHQTIEEFIADLKTILSPKRLLEKPIRIKNVVVIKTNNKQRKLHIHDNLHNIPFYLKPWFIISFSLIMVILIVMILTFRILGIGH